MGGKHGLGRNLMTNTVPVPIHWIFETLMPFRIGSEEPLIEIDDCVVKGSRLRNKGLPHLAEIVVASRHRFGIAEPVEREQDALGWQAYQFRQIAEKGINHRERCIYPRGAGLGG